MVTVKPRASVPWPHGTRLSYFDLDRFSGCSAPHTSCPLSDLQDTKTRNTDSFALLEMLGGRLLVHKEGLTRAEGTDNNLAAVNLVLIWFSRCLGGPSPQETDPPSI
jgi:hypothetical protein